MRTWTLDNRPQLAQVDGVWAEFNKFIDVAAIITHENGPTGRRIPRLVP